MVQYCKQEWQQRTNFSVGRNSIKWEPMVDPLTLKELMSPLDIKKLPYETICHNSR